jgi:hypothetical protein
MDEWGRTVKGEARCRGGLEPQLPVQARAQGRALLRKAKTGRTFGLRAVQKEARSSDGGERDVGPRSVRRPAPLRPRPSPLARSSSTSGPGRELSGRSRGLVSVSRPRLRSQPPKGWESIRLSVYPFASRLSIQISSTATTINPFPISLRSRCGPLGL